MWTVQVDRDIGEVTADLGASHISSQPSVPATAPDAPSTSTHADPTSATKPRGSRNELADLLKDADAYHSMDAKHAKRK